MLRRDRHFRRRTVTWLVAGVAAAGLLLGVGASAAAPSQANRGDAGTNLTWAIQTNPASLFNAFCFCTVGQTVMSLVQDHILAPGTFGQPTTGDGAVVSAWKAVSPTVYRYTVKPGIKFSDGSTLNAADVAFSLNVHRDPATGSKVASFFGNVISIKSKGNVVTVELRKPDSNWQYVPTATPGLVYSQDDYLKKPSAYGTPSGLPLGTGPYRFKEWQPNAKIVLDRNPYYTGKRKYPFDTITIPIIPNEQALLLAVQSGEVDGTFAVPAANFGSWQKAPNTKVGSFLSGGWRGFSFDTEDGPFKDVNVRRALAYSLDMDGINKALNSGIGQVLTGMPPLIFLRGILPKAEIDAALKKVPKYPFSVEKAKAELAKSKYPNGFTTTMNIPGPCLPCTLLSVALQQGAKAIGITINFNVMPGPPRFQVILDHKPGLGIQVLGQSPDTPNPLQFQDLLYTGSHAAPGFENSANLKNPAIDKLIAQGLASTDIKVAARNALKVQAIVAREVPYIHVFTFPVAWAVKKGWSLKSSIGPFYYNQIWLQHLVSK